MNMKKRLENEAYNQKQAAEMYSLLQKFEADYPIDITGDACIGDEVVFLRGVFGGSFKNPKFQRHDLAGLKSWVFRFQEILQTKNEKIFPPINPLKSSTYKRIITPIRLSISITTLLLSTTYE